LGDFDGDDDVDGRDLALLAGNSDGDSDGKGLSGFAADFGKTVCP